MFSGDLLFYSLRGSVYTHPCQFFSFPPLQSENQIAHTGIHLKRDAQREDPIYIPEIPSTALLRVSVPPGDEHTKNLQKKKWSPLGGR